MTSPAPARIRWGILGCARITRRGLIPGIRESTTGTLAALASRDGTTARAWAEEFGVPKAYGSYEEVIAAPEIDAVYIPLPNELHREWTERAADADKHVLCEKPLALDASEARAMVEHCKSRGVVLREAFMWRHQPRTAEILRRVAGGAIGKLRLIRSSFSFPIDMSDWRLDPSRGGGALWDVGTYGVSTARLFAGAEPESIKAVAHFGPSGVDLSLVAALKFPGDILAAIDCSFEQPFRCSYELVGAEGRIEVPDAYLPPERPIAHYYGPSGFVPGEGEEWTLAGTNQYAAMVDAFAEAVATGGKGGAPGEDGLAQMTALDAILAAARGA
jgi:D-xylose 1-dehydrogenase (NADP+, D-xylono-1,5-lactone-forming)